MKQYTTPEQTAKLIEMGFPKPENTQWNEQTIVRGIGGPLIELGIAEYRCSYSIGELIEMLPKEITFDDTKYSRVISENEVCYYSWTLEVYYYIFDIHDELIDSLFYMIVKLKEEGVI